MEYMLEGNVFMWKIRVRVKSRMNVDVSVIKGIIFVVWLGVRDTKYENITSMPLM